MKAIVIEYKKRVLARQPLYLPVNLVGRSPLCDLVVRVPGIHSVHFLIEWIGVGTFDSTTASPEDWVITVVNRGSSNSEKNLGKTVSGQGQIIGQRSVEFGDLSFKFDDDRLSESNLEKKIISQSVINVKESMSLQDGAVGAFEVIAINRETDSVTQVLHYPLDREKFLHDPFLKKFAARLDLEKQQPEVKMKLPEGAVAQHMVGDKPAEAESLYSVIPRDLLHVEWEMGEFYFRLVPRVQVPPSPREIFSDTFYRWAGLTLLLVLAFIWYVLNIVVIPEPEKVELKRLARIEVNEVKPPPVQEKYVVPEKPLEPEKVEEVVEKKAEPPKVEPKIEPKPTPVEPPKQAAAPVRTPKEGEMRNMVKGGTGVGEVGKKNQVGLLGVLKKSSKSPGLVKSDMVMNQGVVSETVAGSSGKIILDQSPTGLINQKTTKPGDGNLSAMTTSVKFKDQLGNDSLTVKGRNVETEGFNVGKGYGKGGAGDEFGGSTNLRDQNVSVEGGLDRESVRRAIHGHGREIRTCYERALAIKSNLKGRVVYSFEIRPVGSVNWVKLVSSTANSATLEDCVKGVIQGIQFPKAGNGKRTLVRYPFEFQAKGN